MTAAFSHKMNAAFSHKMTAAFSYQSTVFEYGPFLKR